MTKNPELESSITQMPVYNPELKFEQNRTHFSAVLNDKGRANRRRQSSILFEIQASPGTIVTFTKFGAFKVSSSAGIHVFDGFTHDINSSLIYLTHFIHLQIKIVIPGDAKTPAGFSEWLHFSKTTQYA